MLIDLEFVPAGDHVSVVMVTRVFDLPAALRRDVGTLRSVGSDCWVFHPTADAEGPLFDAEMVEQLLAKLIELNGREPLSPGPG